MKKIFKFCLVFFVVIAQLFGFPLGLALSQFSSGAIDISVNGQNPWQGTYNIGGIKPGDVNNINFDIQNVGQEPLNIFNSLANYVDDTGTVSVPECEDQGGQWDDAAKTCNWGLAIDKNDVQSQIIYSLNVEVYEAGNPIKIWWQTIYTDNEEKSLSDVYGTNGGGTVSLGVIPAGGHMKVFQSYHFNQLASDAYQGDTFGFDIVVKGVQLLQGEAAKTIVALENKDNIWNIIENDNIGGTLEYSVAGPKFDYSFTGKVKTSDNYTLLYLGENDSYPYVGSVVLGSDSFIAGTAKTITGQVEIGSDIANGKIWLIPTSSYSGGVMTTWPADDILFETSLINYDDIDVVSFFEDTKNIVIGNSIAQALFTDEETAHVELSIGTSNTENETPIAAIQYPNGGDYWYAIDDQCVNHTWCRDWCVAHGMNNQCEYEISWQTQNPIGANSDLLVDIWYSADSGQTLLTKIANSVANSGKFLWKIPVDTQLLSNKARIKIVAVNKNNNELFAQDISDADFTVVTGQTACGNNIVETGEQCDDGNAINGDGCSTTCQTETTGTNHTPTFTIAPYEDPTSDGTTPTNIGSNVTFKATATDGNGDQWYLAVCKTNAVTPGNGGVAPVCNGGAWAISTATASGSQATASYAVKITDTNPTYEWYAFACDNNIGQAVCSSMSNSGTNDNNGSPFSTSVSPGGGGMYVETELDGVCIYQEQTLTTRLKCFPQGWILRLTNTDNLPWAFVPSVCQVEDTSDGVAGYMYKSNLGYNPILQAAWKNKIAKSEPLKNPGLDSVPKEFFSFDDVYDAGKLVKGKSDVAIAYIQILLQIEKDENGVALFPVSRAATNNFGPLTESSVVKFQQKYNLDGKDGKIGLQTKNKFNESLNNYHKMDNTASTILQAVKNYYYNQTVTNSPYNLYNGTFLKNLKDGKFPIELILAILKQEGWYDFYDDYFDNEFVSYDYGHGISQATFDGFRNENDPYGYLKNSYDNRGRASFVTVPVCKSFASNDYFKCYKDAGKYDKTVNKPYKHFDDKPSNPIIKQYSNSAQSIYANIKDGLDVLNEGFINSSSANHDTEALFTFTANLKLGDKGKQVAYLQYILQGETSNGLAITTIFDSETVTALKKFQEHVFPNTEPVGWVDDKTKIELNSLLDSDIYRDLRVRMEQFKSDAGATWRYNHGGVNGTIKTDQRNYLSNVSDRLDTQKDRNFTEVFEKYDENIDQSDLLGVIDKKFLLAIMRNYIEFSIGSPGEIRAYDSKGNITGWMSGESKEEITDSIYNQGNKSLIILLPSDQYRYEVVGTGEADEKTYDLSITYVKNGESNNFNAVNVPISKNEIHDYKIDWGKLANGDKGVEVKIDQNGDGVFEKTLEAGNNFHLIDVNAGNDVAAVSDNAINFSGSYIDSLTTSTKTIHWDFGDGASVEGTLTPTHTYYKAGEYTATLTVTDDDGGVGSDTVNVTVNPIIAKISCDPVTLNLASKGNWLSCYIELPVGYDVKAIDGAKTILNGIYAYLGKEGWAKAEGNTANVADFDGDNILERMVKFDRQALVATLGNGTSGNLEINGELSVEGGVADFTATQPVKIVKNGG